MTYVKPLTMATALALSLTGMNAFAAPHAPHHAVMPAPSTQSTYYVVDPGTPQARKVYYFDRLDRNHDGALSRPELPRDMHMLRAYFVDADLDHNGRLSPAEYVAYANRNGPQSAGTSNVTLSWRGECTTWTPSAACNGVWGAGRRW